VALCGAVRRSELVFVLIPNGETGFHVREFGRLPVLLNGRIQPFDTSAGTPCWQNPQHPGCAARGKKHFGNSGSIPKLRRDRAPRGDGSARNRRTDRPRVLGAPFPTCWSELKLRGKGIEKSGLHYFSFGELELRSLEIFSREQMPLPSGQNRSAVHPQSASTLYSAACCCTTAET